MSAATTTLLGHVDRALQFYNESEIFIGFGKTTAWSNEASPPAPDNAARNIGLVVSESYTGTSLSSSNCVARINRSLFTGGSVPYRLTALSATTFNVRNLTTNGLVGPFTVSANPQSNIVTGVDITVSGTLVANDTYLFTVDGAIGFKVIPTKYLVVPDVLGTLTFGTQNYRIVPSNQAYDQNARWVYLEVSFDYGELPLLPFRQLGVYTSLTRVSGSSNILLPNQVADSGALVQLENKTVIYRALNQREDIVYVVEF